MPQLGKKANRKNTEENYHIIFETSPDAIAIHNGEKLKLINPAGVKMLGAAYAEELVEKPIAHFLQAEDENRVTARFEQVAQGKTISRITEKLTRVDGSTLDVEISAAPYRYRGEPASLLFIRKLEITQQKKQAELLLLQSESRLHQAAELAGLGIWVWDMITESVEWSGAMFNIYGVSPAAFTGKAADYAAFTRADYLATQEKYIANAIECGITEADLSQGKSRKFEPLEICIVLPNGSERYTLGDVVCIVDENHKPLRMLGVTQDITARRETEKKLRESEERFRSLSQATFEGIVIHDHGTIVDANQAFANFFGYKSPDELIGKNHLTLFPAALEAIDDIQKKITTGSSDLFEMPINKSDGTSILVETQAKEFDFKGRRLSVVAVRDITKRKQAENTQVRLTAILEAMPDFVATASPDQQITYLNYAGRKMVGIDINEDITGLKVGDLSPNWATPIIKSGIEYAIHYGIWHGETARLTRDGREFPVSQLIIAHKDSAGKLEYLSTICRDITESKQAEEKIRRQLNHLTALSEIDRAITSSFNLKQSLKTLLRHVTRQLDVDAADAILFDEDTQTLRYLVGTGFRSKHIKNFAMNTNLGYAGRVVRERRTIKVTNLLEKPENYVRADLLAEDAFISYFGVPLIAKGHIKGVLEVFHRTPLDPDDEWLDFLKALAEQAAIAIDNALLFEDLHHSKLKLEQAYDTTLDGWSKALDLRDKETEGHTRRVTELTLQMARKMGFDEEQLVHIKRGGLLHDIGKMGIPDSILLKPGQLTDEEWYVMRKHTTYAYEMLSPIEYLRPALDIPYCHHERWDGTGYPRGLKGDEIPLIARIFSVVDVWDALCSDRPYRKAWEKDKVLQYISSLTGTQFDPDVVYVFLQEIDQ